MGKPGFQQLLQLQLRHRRSLPKLPVLCCVVPVACGR